MSTQLNDGNSNYNVPNLHPDIVGKIAFGKDECLGTVEIPAEFRAETNDYAIHPALMDIATGVAMSPDLSGE